MNLRARLLHLAQLSGQDRRLGKTTEICKIAKDNGGIVVAASTDHAFQLQREHGVISKSCDVNMQGYSGPFFFDHYAVERMFVRAADKIGEQDKELEKLRAELEERIVEIHMLEEKLRKVT